jgi:hypothetical protein
MEARNYTKLSLCILLTVTFTLLLFPSISPAQTSPVTAVIDDFDDADYTANFFGLLTSAGNPEETYSGDLVADYDVFGANPSNPLNTAHQVSWDETQGATTGPDDAFWYSLVSDGSGQVIPVGDFTHLSFKVQPGAREVGASDKRDVLAVDLQVNYPGGQVDGEGKPFRIYRTYHPVANPWVLDLVRISFSDFRDEYDSTVRFTDDLANNLANFRAVAIAMLDPTDAYLMDADGDGFDLNLDNNGTIFIENVGFWNKSLGTTNERFCNRGSLDLFGHRRIFPRK